MTRELARNKSTLLGIAILLVASFVAVFGPEICPHDPMRPDVASRLVPPGWHSADGALYILGTDHLGRDVLSRILFGVRTSMIVGLVCSLGAALLGTSLGLMAGYFSGLVGDAIMRLADMQLAFPFLVLAVTFVSVLGSGTGVLVGVLIVWSWPAFARVVRAETLVAREKDFVMAARAVGVRPSSIILRHVLPNVAASAIVIWTFLFARLIIVESSLSFLGLGLPPPTPTLGGMLSDGRGYLITAWWVATFPGLIITLIVVGANFVGDSLRDALDPTLRPR